LGFSRSVHPARKSALGDNNPAKRPTEHPQDMEKTTGGHFSIRRIFDDPAD
jgi:hypothetical protein